MALFAKDYHPLDSRHPRNRAGARTGDYGVQHAPKTSRSQIKVTKPTPDAASPKRSRSAQLAALAAQTKARAHSKAETQAPVLSAQDDGTPPTAASPFDVTTTAKPPARSALTGLWRTAQVAFRFDQYLRICVLIAFIVYVLAAPDVLTNLVSTAGSGPADLMQTAPNF